MSGPVLPVTGCPGAGKQPAINALWQGDHGLPASDRPVIADALAIAGCLGWPIRSEAPA